MNSPNVSEYNKIKRFHIENVQFLLNMIKDDVKHAKLDIVVDIGCGCGKITSLLKQSLNCNKLVAVDINAQLIESAIANNYKDILFFTQDISLDWDQLRPELKQFEGKVSLIYSNYAIIWYKEKRENAVKNINRLLTTGGKLYVSYTILDSLFHLKNNEKAFMKNFVKSSSKTVRLKEWISLLANNGFEMTKTESQKVHFNFSVEIYQKIIQKMHSELVQMFVQSDNTDTDIDDNSDLLRRMTEKHVTEIVDEESGRKMFKLSSYNILTSATRL